MSNCGNADTPGAANGSQNANARSARRRVVGLAVVVGDMAHELGVQEQDDVSSTINLIAS